MMQPASRPGISDFVPKEDPRFAKALQDHRGIKKLSSLLLDKGIDSLLDSHRLLALTELAVEAADRVGGDAIEMGVYKGGSAAAIAWALRRARKVRTLHLCDTFEGMPETLEWEFHKKFDFGDTSLETVSRQLAQFAPGFPFRFHAGLFSETLSSLGDCRFCFAHVDADLYLSVREACEFVYPRMPKGGIILFDDYGASTCPGAKKAVDEFFAEKIEKPTHITVTVYGVRVGEEKTDFKELLLKRTRLAAIWRAPGAGFRKKFRDHCGQIASPKITRLLSGPWLYGGIGAKDSGARLADARSILVVRQDSIGDLVLMSPFLRELRKGNPRAWITLVVAPRFAEIVELCPYVNEVLGFQPPGPGELTSILRPNMHALRMAASTLWKRGFDMALLPRWDLDDYCSNFLAYFSRARSRVGYSEYVYPAKHQRHPGYDQLLTRVIDGRDAKHEVERNLDLLRYLGGPVADDRLELWLSEVDRSWAEKMSRSVGFRSGDLVVGMSPGAGHARRLWPFNRYIELGRRLEKEFGARALIVGGVQDRELAMRVQEGIGRSAVNFAAVATLRQTAALLEHVQLMVANDSGPMHLAAAAGAAVVEVSCHPKNGEAGHYNSPVRFRPWCRDYAVMQPRQATPPCSVGCEGDRPHCILSISADTVQETAAGLLHRRAGEVRRVC